MNNESHTLWFSRASFAVSVLAFGSFLHSGCKETSLSPEPKPSLMRTAPLQGENAEESPEEGKTAKPSQSTTRDLPKEAPVVERKQDGEKTPAKSAPKEEAELAAAPLNLKRLVVTEAIEEREPSGTLTATVSGTPVYAFVEVESGEGAQQQVEVVFEHESGKKVGFVKLKIPAEKKRWRTWGKTSRITQPGKWTAMVSSEDGKILGFEQFQVEAQADELAAAK